MLQFAEHQNPKRSKGLTDAEQNEIRAKVRIRIQAFYRMQSQIDAFLNPFLPWNSQAPPPFICYILWCIGELSPHDAETMERETPELQREYRQSGTWQEIVAKVMAVNERWNDEVRRMWRRNSHLASENGIPLPPVEFAKQLIERNFHIC